MVHQVAVAVVAVAVAEPNSNRPTMDLSVFTKEHVALIIAILVGLDWIFKRLGKAWDSAKQFVVGVLDERFPAAIKTTLSNGGGEIIRGIIRTENEIQSRLHQEETRRIVDAAIKQHEVQEERKIRDALEELRAEVTGSHAIPGKRKH